MAHVFTLDDPRARDVQVAGAKAAGLARALACGLPVLAGHVVPVETLAAVIATGAAVLDRSPAAARLAVAGARIDSDTVRELRDVCTGFPHDAIVRSSSPQESDPAWSGAFTTYHAVGPEDLETALLGCAASVFSRDVVGRCRELGLHESELGLAALVQPWLPLHGGGVATMDAEGAVSVHGVQGDPASLVAGRLQGVRAVVGPDGEVIGDATMDRLGSGVASEVAALTRRVHAEIGERGIEWGVAEGRLWLLQVRRPPAVPLILTRVAAPTRPPTIVERRLAHLASRYPGPMGEVTVLPWAIALGSPPSTSPIAVADPSSALREILAISSALGAAVWGAEAEAAGRCWPDLARDLLAGTPGRSTLPDLDGLRPPDPAAAARVIGLMAGLGEALVARGSLSHPEAVWRLTPNDAERVVGHPAYRPPFLQGADRWEPFVARVALSGSSTCTGIAASPGIGAGRAHALVAGAGRPGPRAVLVASRPVPQIAPLLWGCAGLVTSEGSEGAHLFEVARSLGVPAVTGLCLDVPGTEAPSTFLAVDGDHGTVAVLEDPSATGELARVGA